ncbi:dehydrogenase [Mesorhizobium australicum]|uniref:dehydrogenase n=1 Tax=Mesorhizobium australicum TaxID=536018 RepID=UPI003335F7E2
MKRTLILIAIGLLCLTTAGCASTQSINVSVPPPQLDEPDRALVKDCLRPVRIVQDGVVVQRTVERLWISDRKALITCGKRFKALRDFYHDRDAAIRHAEDAKK